MELDRVPLWRGDHVAVRQLVEDFARYLYLPRLADPDVLLEAIRDGLGLLLWEQDSFAYAESYDEAAGRYRGLRCGQNVSVSAANTSGLLVRPERGVKQQEATRRLPRHVRRIGGNRNARRRFDDRSHGRRRATRAEARGRSPEALPRHGRSSIPRASGATPAASPTRSSRTSRAWSVRRSRSRSRSRRRCRTGRRSTWCGR